MITEAAIGNKNHQEALDVVAKFVAGGGKITVIPSNQRSKLKHQDFKPKRMVSANKQPRGLK